MEHLYRIEKITMPDGFERLDGRYPLRKGCIGRIGCLNKGMPMYFEYIKHNEGNAKIGCLITSTVEEYVEFEDMGILVVFTLNSVYHLRLLS